MKYNQRYIHGSNAEKIIENYEEKRPDSQKAREKQVTKKKTNTKQKAKHSSKTAYKPKPTENILLASIIMFTLVTLAVLLKVQFAVNDQVNSNIQLQKDIIALKNDNLKLETDISKSMDMNEIYRIASDELGMIQPTKENIRYISTDTNAYTVQYTLLTPSVNSGVNFGDFLGFISEGW